MIIEVRLKSSNEEDPSCNEGGIKLLRQEGFWEELDCGTQAEIQDFLFRKKEICLKNEIYVRMKSPE